MSTDREGGYLPGRLATTVKPGADPIAAPATDRNIASRQGHPRLWATRAAPKVAPRIAPPNHPRQMT